MGYLDPWKRKVKEYETLEELFFNVEDLDGKHILAWIWNHNPDWTSQQVSKQGEFIKVVYDGWKSSSFKLEGNMISLREWEQN